MQLVFVLSLFITICDHNSVLAVDEDGTSYCWGSSGETLHVYFLLVQGIFDTLLVLSTHWSFFFGGVCVFFVTHLDNKE